MIIFPLYALVVWFVLWRLPARWLRLLFIPVALVPVGVITSICIYSLPLPPHEPRPTWLFSMAYAYAGLLAAVGVLIAFVKPAPDHVCHACNYDLSGSELGICPECGAVAKCRNCRNALVHEDFGPCPHCKEPFPRYAPFSNAAHDDTPEPRDRAKLIGRYLEHTRGSA